MTPERDSELRQLLIQGIVEPTDVLQEYKNGVYQLHLEIERLKAEGSPGVMHEIDRGFYNLVVRERDYERRRVNRLEKERQELLESAVLCEDVGDLVLGLIEEAKEQGITKDGRTLA